MFQRKSNWLLDDDELHPADRPGSADWFDLADEVGRGRANQRSDVIKIESLLGRAGLFDVERLDGPLGYANEQLDKPIRDFQRKNGLAVDGYLRPEGPTIGKFKELYGGEYAPFPAPTPAMIDAHHARRDQGEDGFLVDRWPALDVRPHPRLDPLQKDFGFDDWNEAWVRFQAGQRGTFDGMPEELLKNIAQNDVRGIVQARDVARRWAAYRPEDGSAFARRMVQALEGKPILQSAFLAGPVPQSPPLGVPTPTGLADYGKFVRDARAAEGMAEPASQAEAPAPATNDDINNDTQPVQVAAVTWDPPNAPLTRSEKPLGADDKIPVPPMTTINRNGGKPDEDDLKRYEVFVRAARQLPGVGARERATLEHIYQAEGGERINKATTKASSGITMGTLKEVQKRNKVQGIGDIAKPGDIPSDRRAEVMHDYLDEALKKAGGSKVLEEFDDQKVANAIAVSIFHHGPTGGGNVIRKALKKTTADDPPAEMEYVDDRGNVTTYVTKVLIPLTKDPKKRDAFLENLADARFEYLKRPRVPAGKGTDEDRAVTDYLPTPAGP